MSFLTKKHIAGLLRKAERIRAEEARAQALKKERWIVSLVSLSALASMVFAGFALFTKPTPPAYALAVEKPGLTTPQQKYSPEEIMAEVRQSVYSAVNSHTRQAALHMIMLYVEQGRELFSVGATENTAALQELDCYLIGAEMLLRDNVSDLCQMVDYARIDSFIQKYKSGLSGVERETVKAFGALYCRVYDLDPYLFFSLLARESSFRRTVVSHAGAAGLGQIMPANFKMLDIDDPFNIQQNLHAAARHLRGMLDIWEKYPAHQLHLALASYHSGQRNAGKAIVRGKFVAKNLTPLTIDYVNDIINFSNELKTQK